MRLILSLPWLVSAELAARGGAHVLALRCRKVHGWLLLPITTWFAVAACGGGEPPEPPINQRFGYEGSAIVVQWDESDDAEFYKVYVADSPDPGCRLEAGEPSPCIEIGRDVPFGWFEDASEGRYNRERNFYWVVACNDSGCSEIDSANPALSPPGTPQNLSAALDGPSILVDWDPVPDATHYGNLLTCSHHNNCRLLVDVVHGETHTYTPPPPQPFGVRVTERTSDSLIVQWPAVHERYHGRYEFRLSACNEAGCSRPSVSAASAGLSYSYVGRYQVHRRSEQGQFELVESTATRTEYVDLDVRPDSVYFYKVQYCTDVECSAHSDETGGLSEAAGEVDVPAAPGGFRGEKIDVSGGGDDARVLWNATAGATWYEVFQDTDSTWPDAEISAPQTSYRDSSPNRGAFGTYLTTSYRVRACNKAGCSALTEFVTLD
ncbi:MAG: fibronectin type III domain-containing protein [Chloroflexi bacterium]|nr:fibronectin type III domain-containing protein [Chloroflexota bacterium]MYD15548.1 fibronectin type III domain-containing protein [Chloroflexota bacterium]